MASIEVLPHKHDLKSVSDIVRKIGWKSEPSGDCLIVYPTGDEHGVLVSGRCYKFCGAWIRPVYARIDLETYIDVDTMASVLLRTAFLEMGSVALMDCNKANKSLTITYRVFLPADCTDVAPVLEGIMAAIFGKNDLVAGIKRIHQPEPKP